MFISICFYEWTILPGFITSSSSWKNTCWDLCFLFNGLGAGPSFSIIEFIRLLCAVLNSVKFYKTQFLILLYISVQVKYIIIHVQYNWLFIEYMFTCTTIDSLYLTKILTSHKNVDIRLNGKTKVTTAEFRYAGLTALAKNRATWLLPQRTSRRNEGTTWRLPTDSQKHFSTKMCRFFASIIFCIWSVP